MKHNYAHGTQASLSFLNIYWALKASLQIFLTFFFHKILYILYTFDMQWKGANFSQIATNK